MTAKLYTYNVVVEGYGAFPLDMLRYDRCYPRSERDASSAESATSRRRVELVCPARPALWMPTTKRWDSFGWRVVEWSKQDE